METHNRLTKSPNKWISGVCAGIAEYLGLSTDGVRLAWLFITIFTAFMPGCLAYLLLHLLMPKRDEI